MLEGSKRRKVRPKERLLLQRVSWLPPWVGVGNSHDARAPAGAPSVRGFENHASLRVRRAIKKIETQRHRAIASNYGHTGRVTGVAGAIEGSGAAHAMATRCRAAIGAGRRCRF